MARLLLATPEGNQVVELVAHNSLGRHPGNTIQLLDRIVSKEHCVIEQRGELFVLRDLGSLNGTYVNGARVIGERALHSGDEIALGDTRARYEQDSGAAVAASKTPATNSAGAGWSLANPSVASTGVSAARGPEQPSGTPSFGVAPAPLTFAFGSIPSLADQSPMPFAPAMPPVSTRRVDVSDRARAIGTQIAAAQKGFLPYDQIHKNPQQLAADYERLRLSHELSREIALERDLPTLLDKILQTIFKFIHADRGAIFLMAPTGELVPAATRRRDGTDQPITVSSTILNHVIKERATVLTHDAAMDFAASKGKSMILNRISSAVVAPLLHNDEVLGVLWLDSESLAQFQQKDMEIATAIAAQAAMFIEINILAKKIEQEIVNRERFSRLLSPNVAERVLSGELEVKKGGQLVPECTVFNSDIRGFTRMSEGAPPESIVEMLNEYFELMVETVFKYEGTLDKFMGDGIMALWGAPVVHPDDPALSVECAIEQLEVLARFNKHREEFGLLPLGMGIGIHTGPLVAGYIGSSKSLSYTVIGDTANTSARLCGIAQAGQILVSEQTLLRLGTRYVVEELPPAHLKGKEKPFRVFDVRGRAPLVGVGSALGPTLDGH
ncbi:MAG TPA: adenylate/guanylate cyclase domain-containing protein [Polyangiaceae bacterium]|nr:adenylate/guanylate cyclase domain-containing protein [Polyangiaceae bacterium]